MAIHIYAKMVHGIKIRRLMVIMSIFFILIVSQCHVYTKISLLPPDVKSSKIMTLQNVTSFNHSDVFGFHEVHSMDTVAHATSEKSDYKSEKKGGRGLDFTSDAAKSTLYKKSATFDGSLVVLAGNLTVDVGMRERTIQFGFYSPTKGKILENSYRSVDDAEVNSSLDMSGIKNHVAIVSNQSSKISRKSVITADPKNSDLFFTQSKSSSPEEGFNKTEEKTKDKKTERVNNVSITLNELAGYGISTFKSLETPSISISQMNTLLSLSHNSSCPKKPECHWSSPRERELLYARLEIEKATALVNSPGISASVFRNVSLFKRSYDLMEQMLKVYIYKEGEKPIFHQPVTRGIYASEGWFMKLIKENKKFVVKDPKKAHLFYLPFSSQLLRKALSEQNFHNRKDLEEHLRNYVDLIGRKYRFWNRSGGSDHFLVACHDWASRLTRQHMKNCIRALCNANAARGFQIGKDTSLPATYIHLTMDTMTHIGVKTPSERTTLAFFAGGIHGYLRPILLYFWENKEPDMKIFGPMPRNIEGKRVYREHMKNSKYCICARGYEVHSPRVVEAILNECVPVIISDNYVPPFFEVLKWESFSVFVQEKEISNLRNILLSIPEKNYLAMHARLKLVQKHFMWHKRPEKYDLFHMILHSVWYNRVFQMKTK